MIDLTIHTQPDDETCGPTCLHAMYAYYGLDISLETVVGEVERSLSGGTLAPLLGKHALMHDFETTIYINNLDVFDPTWFENCASSRENLIAKLDAQMKHKWDKGILQSSIAYQDYLKSGGDVRFNTISVQLLKEYFNQKIPILTGLSATYLYRSAREIYSNDGVAFYDDIRGTPCGHFVVLCGYDDKNRHIIVADPHRENPLSHDNYYKVNSNRLINAIMLGVYTYDANLLIIKPKRKQNANGSDY
ncbi:C39 family peptidase [Legionella oakridgensis]|uniref:Guanylyl cyclase n=2 Tax=Legionella oakridgensis TaxID=29423 RepID=W0BBL9_9GAMM|nr:C39 family peptidase [Legionella oakridgensis]AHE66022.1 guanylyl cyclase [Legionella oakridgensis ATCC 33761 = DSM 21215]ETO94252.1 peptidase_C39 like family [Legionella oakridgensis RV-2-2007]KTD43571.1 Guanylyl cyclase [Legionella oakridgensis]STY15946.1 Guanylyl cyclase [Legionella longbeachae]